MNARTKRIERVAVKSSCIAFIGYSKADQVLEVEFRSGVVYRYFAVPPGVLDSLIASESMGAHLNRFIKGNFNHIRLAEK